MGTHVYNPSLWQENQDFSQPWLRFEFKSNLDLKPCSNEKKTIPKVDRRSDNNQHLKMN